VNWENLTKPMSIPDWVNIESVPGVMPSVNSESEITLEPIGKPQTRNSALPFDNTLRDVETSVIDQVEEDQKN